MWGLSQECAATLISLLPWEGESSASAFRVCGRLPLRQHMTDITDPQTPSDHSEDPFAWEKDPDQGLDFSAQAVAWVRNEFDLTAVSPWSVSRPSSGSSPAISTSHITHLSLRRIPLLWAHGTEDEKVKIELGHEARKRNCLVSLWLEVNWREYQGLAHWYSSQMLEDVVDFLGKMVTGTEKLETNFPENLAYRGERHRKQCGGSWLIPRGLSIRLTICGQTTSSH